MTTEKWGNLLENVAIGRMYKVVTPRSVSCMCFLSNIQGHQHISAHVHVHNMMTRGYDTFCGQPQIPPPNSCKISENVQAEQEYDVHVFNELHEKHLEKVGQSKHPSSVMQSLL